LTGDHQVVLITHYEKGTMPGFLGFAGGIEAIHRHENLQ